MKPLRQLRQVFLAAVSLAVISAQSRPLPAAQNDNTSARDALSRVFSVRAVPLQDAEVAQAKFDYAFGDQVAASFNLPGACGDKWGIDKTMQGLIDLLAKDPEALRGKNVIVAIGDCTYKESKNKEKLAHKFQQAVGADGAIVVMGISATYDVSFLGFSIDVNGKIQKLIKEYNKKINNFVYGGAILGATSDDNIYPVTPQAFAGVRAQAQAALQRHETAKAIAEAAANKKAAAPASRR